MKKILLAFCFGLFNLCYISAQTYWDSSRPNHRFTFGVRAGCNFSKTYQGNHYDTDFGSGFQIGAIVDVNIIRSISVETGVSYIQKRHYFNLSFSDEFEDFKMKPAFIEIPLLLVYHIPLSDNASFHFNAGAYMALGITSSDRASFDGPYSLKKTDWGGVAGVAVTYRHYYIGAHYERSLIDASNAISQGVQNAAEEYIGSIILSLGYNF